MYYLNDPAIPVLVLKPRLYGNSSVFKECFTELKNPGESTTTIGYTRKSHGNGPIIIRARLLQDVINKLRNCGWCFKVSVLPQSNADKLLVEGSTVADPGFTGQIY